MGRPKGMKKVDGVWYLPNGDIAPSSKAKVSDATGSPLVIKKAKGYSDTTMAPVASEKPAHKATEVSESATQEATAKVQGTHMYTPAEIIKIEGMTGLKFAGNFAEQDSGQLIPIFLRADHSEEERRGKITSIRRGF